MKNKKIKIRADKPRRPKTVPPKTSSDRFAHSVSMGISGSVFKNHPFLEEFWTMHPTKAAIDAVYAYLVHQKKIQPLRGSPVLDNRVSRKQKLAIVRKVMEEV